MFGSKFFARIGGFIMAVDYDLIGERLKKARLAKGLTQENLAESLNISIAYLSRIETRYNKSKFKTSKSNL